MTIQISLSDTNQAALIQYLIDHLYNESQSNMFTEGALNITAFVEGSGLACPMPLLKTKMALRSMAVGESVYVIATDPNSQMDLAAFCHQRGLVIQLQAKTDRNFNEKLTINFKEFNKNSWQSFDTIFHVIITKTHGN